MKLLPRTSCGFRHVGAVGEFCPNYKKPIQTAAFNKLSVEASPNLKPQLHNTPLNPYSAGVSENTQHSECGYSPYGRGQHLLCLPIPVGEVSRAQTDFFNRKTKGAKA